MKSMEMLRRSSVFAAEVMEVFDRSPTDKELVSQSKMLCRDYIHSRLTKAGIGWTKSEFGSTGGILGEVSTVLLWLGKACLILPWKKAEDIMVTCSSAACLVCLISMHPVYIHW